MTMSSGCGPLTKARALPLGPVQGQTSHDTFIHSVVVFGVVVVVAAVSEVAVEAAHGCLSAVVGLDVALLFDAAVVFVSAGGSSANAEKDDDVA